MGKNYLKGSYTVEAAVVVSLTFLVLASLMIGAFYLHDRVVLQGFVCEMAAAGSNFMTEAERKEAMGEVKKRLNANRFLGSRGLSGNAAAGKKEAAASWQAVYPVPGFAVKYISGNLIDIRQNWTCKIPDPADTIRKVRGIGDLLTGGES